MTQLNPLMELERALADIRLSRSPLDERLEELKQDYETVLSLLESQFLGALLSGDWSEFDQFVKDFRCPQTQPTTTEDRDDDRNAEASAKDLSRQGTDFCEAQTTTVRSNPNYVTADAKSRLSAFDPVRPIVNKKRFLD